MLVHNRQIIALGKVDHDERSLSGKGTPQEPLGVQNYELLTDQQWVKNYVSAVAGDTIPYSGSDSVKVDEHKISVKDTWLANQLQSYTYNKQTIDSKDTAVRNQFSAYIPRTASAGWDVKPYTGDNVKVQVDPSTHQITIIGEWYVTPEGLTEELLKYYTKSQVDALIAELGGYAVVPLKNNLPDPESAGIPEISWHKYIFLTKDETVTGVDKYKEWIWSGAWECIGETSLDLSEYVTETELAETLEPYATKHFVSAGYQEKGNYVSASELTKYYTKTETEGKIAEALDDYITEDEADRKYQPSGDYLSANALDNYYNKGEVDDLLTDYIKTEEADQRYQAIGDYLSANALDPIKTASGNWDTAYEYIQTYSAGWNEVSAKLNKSEFNEYSAGIKQWIDQTENWDVQKYEGTDGVEVDDHTIRISADFVSASQLNNYYTREETSGADQLSAEFNKYQPSGNYVEFEDMDELLEPYAFTSAVSGFHNTVLSADETVDIDREILQDGTYKYTLHVEPGDVTQISAHRGISAEKNEETGEWVIGLSDAVVSFGRFYQTLNDGEDYYHKSELYGDTIEYDTSTNEIYLNPGIFHIDTQVNIVVPANIYDDAVGNYTIQVAPKIGSTVLQRPTVTREVENTYEHTETIELSFDVKIDSRKKFGISVTGLPVGVRTDYEIQNINIHEQITSIAQLEGGAGTTYIAGEAITISPDTNSINVNAGGGLEIDQATNTIKVKVGNGLKIVDTGELEGTLELNEVTEEVIQEVQKMESDLQTKVTVNFDYANITGVTDFANQGNPNHTGVLLGFLFAVPINSTLYGPNDSQDYESVIGVYSKQVWDQSNIILGLYEYDPSYYNEQTHEWGRTVPKCDTGPVNLKQGLNEFTIKHFNSLSETDKELKSGCLYYAAIYVPVDAGSNILLASCPGYGQNNTFNAVPQLTLDQANIGGYLQTGHYVKGKSSWPDDMNDLSFNNFGWGSWAGDYNFHELPEVPRFFMQIRNRVKR